MLHTRNMKQLQKFPDNGLLYDGVDIKIISKCDLNLDFVQVEDFNANKYHQSQHRCDYFTCLKKCFSNIAHII